MFASLPQSEMCTDPVRHWIIGHRKQFRQHEVKIFNRVKTNLPGCSCHISTQIMKSLETGMSFASLQLCICFSCFQSSSWRCPVGDCHIHVTCETTRCSSSVHISLVSLKETIGYWLPLIDWSNALEQCYIKIWYIFM